jgi:ActR/RegA family two-component response regulator
MPSLIRDSADSPYRGWRAAYAGSSTGNPVHATSSAITPLTNAQRPLSQGPELAVGTDFVLYVEDNDDLRELVVELVTVVLKRRCVGVGSYEELAALGKEALRCSIAILDINLGPGRRSGIDAYAWLRDHGYQGRIVFLTGHASSHPLVVEAQRIGDAEIFSKPIEPDRLRSIVEGERQ